VSYYSALGLAPFLLIVLAFASFIGTNARTVIIEHTRATFSFEVSEIIRLVFINADEGLKISSVSGILGTLLIFFTASLVFTRFRYSFDVIYGYRTEEFKRSHLEALIDKFFAMFFVFCGALLLVASLALMTYVEFLFGPGVKEPFVANLAVFLANFLLYFILFTGLHHFAPSKRPEVVDSVKMSLLSTVFFIIGNLLLTGYLKTVAAQSVYGAAGTLLIFLIWAFYSSFTIFLSAELFLFVREIKKEGHLAL
jgi:membrane protein